MHKFTCVPTGGLTRRFVTERAMSPDPRKQTKPIEARIITTDENRLT